jgi:hypothetical protein
MQTSTLGLSESTINEKPRGVPPSLRSNVKLSELKPKSYVNTTVRVLFIKGREKRDELGRRPYIYGAVEDRTFRVPFVCYRPYHMFFKDSVFRFENAYVHNFNDNSLLLVLTEHSHVKLLPEEPLEEYVWKPKIGLMNHPLGPLRVTLEGVISKIHDGSGLVKRCERCGRVLREGSCPSCGCEEWYWTARISCRLTDDTGSINTIFPQYLTCRILGKTASEMLYLAKVGGLRGMEGSPVLSFAVNPPEKISVNMATVPEPSIWNDCEELIVQDRKNSRIISPLNVKPHSGQVLKIEEKILNYQAEEDRKIIGRILEKALGIEIRRRTGHPKLHGIYLTEKPIRLFGSEAAKLYLGFELEVKTSNENVTVNFCPSISVRESVLDYIAWRRRRGASAASIENTLLKWRRNVSLAPHGTLGTIRKVLYEEAGSFKVPALDVSLPKFWRTTYGIKVDPEEKPLLIIEPYNMNVKLTYPPSCVFFDEETISLKKSIKNFVEYKKAESRKTIYKLAWNIMRDLTIEGWKTEITSHQTKMDIQRMILSQIRRKLYGKKVKATGSVIQRGDSLFFIPKHVTGVYR